jgi:NADPH-dependent 2,4-dienoyl-CoA reductase/sulfur reductase-like enzyme
MSRGAGVLIVGGGLAGQRCAETLRSRGYEGRIRIACAEPEPPYDRPPLSKELLAGSVEGDEASLRPGQWYDDNAVELLLGRGARRLDPSRHVVELEDGEEVAYEKLLIATGSQARRLPMLDGFENVGALRTLEDARRLREHLQPGSRLAVVGAGFIGQEVAATARGLGVDVTIVEALDLPLAPILGERVGRWFARLHTDEGVRLLLSARLEAARGNGQVEELVLADGRSLTCDAVVVGVGVAPSVDWLAGTGLEQGAVATDCAGRTALSDVYAAGDASAPFEPRFGQHARTEHWDAAARQGAAAAQAMLGVYPGTPPLPSFWSDQYGLRIQYVGHADRADDVAIEGDPDSRDFAAVFARDGVPVGALAVGRPRAIARMRRLIDEAYWNKGKQTEARAA